MVVRPPNKSQNVNSGEETSPAAPAKIRIRNPFDYESSALPTELSRPPVTE